MGQFKKLRDWLDNLEDTEFRDMIRSLLSPQEQTRLKTSVESINRGDLLGTMQKWKKLDAVEHYLVEKHPDRFTKISEPSPPNDIPMPRLPFTNREDELKLVLSSFGPAYYLVDAPAGYGKTEFLKELKRRFIEQNWQCAYVSVKTDGSLRYLTDTLVQELGILPLRNQRYSSSGKRIGGVLRKQWKKTNDKEGIILLIDLENKPNLSILEELLSQYIPAIQKSLRTLQFFDEKHNRFRVIIAGRYLSAKSEIRNATLPLRQLPLSPFSYNIIKETVDKYLEGDARSSINQLSAHLMYLTGGHPGCINSALIMYDDQGVDPDTFLEDYEKTIWEEYVRKVTVDIQYSISNDLRPHNQVLNDLSVFRYLDHVVLRYLLQGHKLSDKINEYDFGDILTATYILGRKGRFLKDDISRRLLTIRLWNEYGADYERLCQQAQVMCIKRLKEPNVQSPEIWAIEYLFQTLQQHACVIQEPEQRRVISQKFFNEDVPKILQSLVYDRDAAEASIREERDALKQAMEGDWEFQFTVNYYLREGEFNSKPYHALQQTIYDFFEQQ